MPIKISIRDVRVRNFSSTKDPQSVRGSEIFFESRSSRGPVRNPHISGQWSLLRTKYSRLYGKNLKYVKLFFE